MVKLLLPLLPRPGPLQRRRRRKTRRIRRKIEGERAKKRGCKVITTEKVGEPSAKRAQLEAHQDFKFHFHANTVSDEIKAAVQEVAEECLVRSAQRQHLAMMPAVGNI